MQVLNYVPKRFVKISQCEPPKQNGHEFRYERTYVTVKRCVSTTHPRPNAVSLKHGSVDL